MTDDAELLSRYADTRSEAAFAELVERHLGMVYHSALRQLGGDVHRANDVVQGVFVLLAEKAQQLRGHPSLAGWLHTATRLKAVRVLREEARRRIREMETETMNEIQRASGHDEEWAKLRPVIDEVLAELSDEDREAVLLRFFEGRSFAEIGERLRLNEKSAHTRGERALEKVRARLTRRGIVSAAALAGALGTQAGLAAPAGLAASVSAAASAATIAPATVGLVGAFGFMATSKIVMGAAALVIAGAGFVLVSGRRAEAASRQALEGTKAWTTDWEARLKAERERLDVAENARRELEAAYDAERRAAQDRARASEAELTREGAELMRKYPELREALIASARASMRNRWEPLLAELGLDEERAVRFLDLKIGNSATMVGEHVFILFPGKPEQPEAEQLKAILGDAGYERYRDYEKGTMARAFANDLTGVLYKTENPLTRDQAEKIQAIVGQAGAAGSWEYAMPEKSWEELRAYAEESLPPEQLEAIDGMHAKWSMTKQLRKVVRAYYQAVERGEVTP